ncbi:MAG: hypothetical protein MJ250_08740 [Alphaproteobacteria bacterium]|nr:hypothetical protein [Alphaproteobacteria bacterium]
MTEKLETKDNEIVELKDEDMSTITAGESFLSATKTVLSTQELAEENKDYYQEWRYGPY